MLNMTAHTQPGMSAEGEDVQKSSGGVFGKDVWSILGPEVAVRSTMDINSFMVGKRKPGPEEEQ